MPNTLAFRSKLIKLRHSIKITNLKFYNFQVNDSNTSENIGDFQTLSEETNKYTSLENDSLKQNFNINVGKANKFYNQTIKEENENDNEDEANLNESSNDPIMNDQ